MPFRPDSVAAPTTGRFRPDAASAPAAVASPPAAPARNRVTDFLGSIPGVGLLGTAAEAVWNSAAKIPAGFAGIGAAIVPGGRTGEEAVNDVQNFLQVTPTPIGQIGDPLLHGLNKALEFGEKAVAPAASLMKKGVEKLPDGAQQIIGAGGQAAMDIANVVPGMAAAGRLAKPAMSATEAGVAARATTPEAQAQAAGLRVRPTDVQARGGKPSMGGRAAEALGGSRDLGRDFQIQNRQTVNKIVSEDIGIPPGTAQMDDAAFQAAKAPHIAVYDEMRALPAAPVDAEFRSAVQRSGNNSVLLPASSEIGTLKAHLISQPTMSGNELVDTISRLRERATRDSKMGASGDSLDLADAQMALADSLEDYLQRRADTVDTSLAQRYREARRGFAKINAAEMAMDGYNVDPQKLARYGQKHPNRLDGGLAVVAEQARHFPDVMAGRIAPVTDSNLGSLPWLRTAAGVASLGLSEAVPAVARSLVGRAGKPKLGPEGPLGSFYRERPPVTGGPVDPFASDLTLAPDGPVAAPPAIPGQISFAEVLAEPAPEWPIRPGRPGPPEPPTASAVVEPPGPFPSLPGSPLQAARQASLADQLAGDLALTPDAPQPGYVPSAADLVEWDRPSDIGARVPGIEGAPRLADNALQLEGGPSIEDMLRLIDDQDSMPRQSSNTSFADQLGPTRDPLNAPPDRRQGFDALAEPTSGLGLSDQAGPPQDFSALIAELGMSAGNATPPRFTSDYVPARGVGDLKLFRGVPDGADPFAAGPAGGTHWAPDRPTATRYGDNVAERQVNPSDFQDVGTIEQLRELVGASPDATVEELLRMFGQRSGRPRGVSYTLPPELDGTPREYFEFKD